ncbi:MAG: hypothetical protein ACRD3W_02695, partial [Terriglobales bacterium]
MLDLVRGKSSTLETTPKPAQTQPAEAKTGGPSDRPKPEGFDAAVKLYTQKKYPLAQKAFEKMIKDGVADVPTHAYLAGCYYGERNYTKAMGEFSWVAKYGTGKQWFKMQHDAENSASALQVRMSGICPNSCMK